MKTIKKLDFSKLWHSEYPFVYNKMVEIIEKHNPAELNLQNALKRVKSHMPALRKIEIQESSSIYSKQLEEIDNQRDNITRAIYDITKSWISADLEATRAQADTVMDVLKKHHARFLANETYHQQTLHTKELLNEIEKKQNVGKAIKKIHIDPLFDELKKINARFEEIFSKRAYEQAELEKIDCKAIRNAADKAMKRLLKLIDLYQEEHPKQNYNQLIDELNNFLKYHKAIVKKRAPRFIEETHDSLELEDPTSTPMN